MSKAEQQARRKTTALRNYCVDNDLDLCVVFGVSSAKEQMQVTGAGVNPTMEQVAFVLAKELLAVLDGDDNTAWPWTVLRGKEQKRVIQP